MQLEWTDYMRFRVQSRGFSLEAIEQTVRYSNERYIDDTTGRLIAIGKDFESLFLVAYEVNENIITPVTVHRSTRKQIVERLKAQRYLAP